MVKEEEVDVDMRDAQEPDSTHTTAQTTSWEEFERFGFAEGSYTHKFHAFDEAVDNPQKSNKVYSDEFEIAAYSWQLLVMPKGNDQKPGQQASISIFLKSAEAKVLPPSILPKASFKLSIINHVNPEGHVEKDTEHRFSEKEDDWGFMAFYALADLKAKKDEFFPDGVLHIKTTMRVELEEKYTGVTRQRTGYVGLKNQGATCYMNSLLQALFHVKQFRRAVYHMPTQEGEEADGSIPLAMKHLFFRLQYSPTPVSTKELVRSFGWTSMEAFVQQDVEELELKLCEKLEEKMKGTIVDKSVDRLLKGKTYNFIKCKNVDYSSTKTEEFLDLQLDVMGCKGVQDSLDKICKVEELSGDNKYDAEGHGLQDATKGILFQDLPPVLQLHLRRFDFDLQSWTSIKVNSRYEFHDTLDFNPEHMAPTADPAVPPHYKLYAVLVHSGASQGGHYYAYIRPDKRKEEWFKFDDETVTQVDQEEAISQQYGGESTQLSGGMSGYRSKPRSLNNAYMLVYVRDLDWDKVMAPTGKDEVSEHVRKELEQQLAAKDAKRRAKMQAHRFVSFKVVTDSLIKKHVETEAFHLANTDDLPEDHTFKLDKTLTWSAVMQRIEELTGIPTAQQVYFLFVQQGQQHRPAIPLFPQSHAHEPIKHKHRSLIQNELAPRGHNIRMGYVKGGGMSTLNPVVMYVHHLQTETVSLLESNILHRCLVFVKEYSPEERMMRLLKSIVVQRGVLVRDFVRGCLGSTDAAPVECPDNFIMWEEEQTEPELLLPEVQDKMSLDQVLDMEGGEMARHGSTFIVQRVVEAGLAAAQRAAAATNGEGGVAAAAVAAGMSASARAKEEQPPISAASHYRTGTAGAYDANAPAAAAVSAVPVANGTHVEAPQDDLMHDTTENEVMPGADDFATADGFMRHVHSLRRLIFSPLPGGVGVRGVPGSTSTANLTLQGDAAGDSADGAPASTASAGGGLPTVTIEVLKNAAYEDVVRALANKLGQCQPQYLRITLHNAYTQLPLRRPLESGQAFVAQRCHSFTHPIQVYYEVLDMPLEELEKLKALRVKMVKANTELVRMLTVRLAPAATIADLLEKAMQQAAPGYADSKKLRALKVYSSRVFDVCNESASIDDIDTSYWQLRVEPVPPDDLETAQRCTQEGVEFIPAFFTHSHMQQETIHDYGDPLVLLLHPKETMVNVISRIRQRLKLEEDDVKDWKWGVRAHLSQPEQISELSTVVAERLAEMAEHQSMKFEHPPFISMFHEQKGYAGRAPQAHNWVGREAQINIS